jgi:hypothetical protein
MAIKHKGIYIVEFNMYNDKKAFKIGISDNVPNRVKHYMSPWCRPITRIEYLPCQYPKIVGQYIKSTYSYKTRGSPEFFIDTTFEKLKNVIFKNRYRKHEGMIYTHNTVFSIWIVLKAARPDNLC